MIHDHGRTLLSLPRDSKSTVAIVAELRILSCIRLGSIVLVATLYYFAVTLKHAIWWRLLEFVIALHKPYRKEPREKSMLWSADVK